MPRYYAFVPNYRSRPSRIGDAVAPDAAAARAAIAKQLKADKRWGTRKRWLKELRPVTQDASGDDLEMGPRAPHPPTGHPESTYVGVRMPRDVHEAMRHAAQLHGMTLAGFVRVAIAHAVGLGPAPPGCERLKVDTLERTVIQWIERVCADGRREMVEPRELVTFGQNAPEVAEAAVAVGRLAHAPGGGMFGYVPIIRAHVAREQRAAARAEGREDPARPLFQRGLFG